MADRVRAKSRSGSRMSSGRGTAAKPYATKQGGTGKGLATTASAGKEELRVRVEKLERANATLRTKSKDLRIVALETQEQVDALTLELARSERRADRKTQHEAPAENPEKPE